MYKRNIEARSRNYCCYWKAKSITYSNFVFVAFGIQHAMRMSRIVFLIRSLSGFTVFFHIFFHKRYDFRKVIEHKKCILIFSTTLKRFSF